MTGAEHFREAEKLIDRSWHFTYGDGADVPVGHAFAAMAQVHATLALADAVASVHDRQAISDAIREHAENTPHLYPDGSS